MHELAIQKDYQPVIDDAMSRCQKYFGSRLMSIYIGGSVGACEAWPGESDVDSFLFIQNEPQMDEKTWCTEMELLLAEQHPVAKEVHLNLYSLDVLRTESFWRFVLKYNSLRIYGSDLIAKLEEEGIPTEPATKELAQKRLGWAKKCFRGLLDGKLPNDLFQGSIPSDLSRLNQNSFQATRKLARNFVLLEGAYVLMANNVFISFRQKDVLQALRLYYPQWKNLILKTTKIFENPFKAKVPPKAFIEEVIPFVEWSIHRTESA